MSDRASRAAQRRATWRIERASRDEGVPPAPDSAEARLKLVEELSRHAWALTGKPFPTYERHEMPIVRRKLHGSK